MKKYFAIAVTTCLFIASCSKADLAADQNEINSSVAYQIPIKIPTLPPSYCFTITNTETDFGILEYRLKYTDCNGIHQNIPLLMGESITVCLANGTFVANFSHTVLKAKKC